MLNLKASRKSKKKEGGEGGTKQRSQRATSNVFSMFDQSQIAEFKEVSVIIVLYKESWVVFRVMYWLCKGFYISYLFWFVFLILRKFLQMQMVCSM